MALLRYLWAFPPTLLGLGFAFCAWRFGARVTVRGGIVEVEGPGVRSIANALAPSGHRIRALSLGHVVLARDAPTLETTRAHEAAHVRQYERWGAALVPAYLLAGLWAGRRGGDFYRDNVFEKGAPFC